MHSSPDIETPESRLSAPARLGNSNLTVSVVAFLCVGLLSVFAYIQSPDGDPMAGPQSFTSPFWWLQPIERNRFLRPSPDGAVPASRNLHGVALSVNGDTGWAVGERGTLLRSDDGGRSWTVTPIQEETADDASSKQIKRASPSLISSALAQQAAQSAPAAQGAASDRTVGPRELDILEDELKHATALPPRQALSRALTVERLVREREAVANDPETRLRLSELRVRATLLIDSARADIAASEQGKSEGADAKPSGAPGKTSEPNRDAAAATKPAETKAAANRAAVERLTEQTTAVAAAAKKSAELIGAAATVVEKAAAIEKAGKAQPPVERQTADAAKARTEAASNADDTRDRTAARATAQDEQGLNGVYFHPDAKHGWIVGNKGVILHTENGGDTWHRFLLAERRDLNAIGFDAKGEHGWAVGSDGIVAVPLGSGIGWRSFIAPSASSPSARAIVAFGDGTAWIAGDKGLTGQMTRESPDGRIAVRHSGDSYPALRAIAAIGGTQRGLAVGDGGAAANTSDGGQTWERGKLGNGHTLRAVLFSGSGQLGWAVGDAGTIVATRDGGAKWDTQTVGGSHFRAIAFANDAERGVVVGNHFAIYTTTDGGRRWQPISHARYPAPWFYAASLLILVATLWRYKLNQASRVETQAVTSIVDTAQSDEPVERVDQDRLGFDALVKGLARYLRNEATLPPLTIAINAPWGGGKSSVMRMLRNEMRTVGVRSVWFNAWHHQKEEVMLAALLQSIRAEALPFWLTPAGMTFRLRLLWRRIVRHPFWSALAVFTLLLATTHLARDLTKWIGAKASDTKWLDYIHGGFAAFWDSSDASGIAEKHLVDKLADGKIVEFLSAAVSAVFGTPEMFLYSAEVALIIGAIVATFLYGFRAFPDSPAVLLASVANRFKVSEVEAQTSYRHRFRMHFGDVCAALLPRTMLIFIDDLDRCDPAKTGEMLEAINYLVNSGPCFVVLGMARDVVEAQLATQFAAVADAHSSASKVNGKPANGRRTTARPIVPEKDFRATLDYVRSYLRKLINLEINVPQLTEQQIYSLLDVQHDASARVPAGRGTDALGAHRLRDHLARITESLSLLYRARGPVLAVSALFVAGIVLVAVVYPQLASWDQVRLAKLKQGRASAEERLNGMRKAEQRATVALDFARGREKKFANVLYDHYGIVVAGLEFRVPVARRMTSGQAPEPCEELMQERSRVAATASAAKDDRPAGRGKPPPLEESQELACWRLSAIATRAVDAQLAQIKASLTKATAAKTKHDFGRVAAEAAKSEAAAKAAEQASGLTHAALDPAIARGSSPPLAGRTQAEAPDTPPVYATAKVTWPNWVMPALILLMSLGATVYEVSRRDNYVIRDQQSFRIALGLWSRLLGSQLTPVVPRELKRFQNRARYFAMRLRRATSSEYWFESLMRWFGRPRSREDKQAAVQTTLAEDMIVALTAIHQVEPTLLTSPESPFFDGKAATSRFDPHLVDRVRALIAEHNEKLAQPFPTSRGEIVPFLAVIGEFQREPSDDGTAPALRIA